MLQKGGCQPVPLARGFWGLPGGVATTAGAAWAGAPSPHPWAAATP